MRDRYRHSCRKPNASGRKVEPLVENGGWNSAHLRQNEQDRDKLLAPVQEINHLLEELEKKQQRLNQLREPPAHPTTH
jgi:DNA repair exonuclease SbcCD ATPase subunit